jgi:hypothetical protein
MEPSKTSSPSADDDTMKHLLRFGVAALATWRLTHLLSNEDGPSETIARVRERLGSCNLGKLMDCFHCTSMWVAMPFTFYVGFYLAETGTGLQIFLMHGSKQLTPPTGTILPNEQIGRAFWDDNEHLYVPTGDNLYVFEVGTSAVKQAPRSPFLEPAATSIIVLPRQ